MSDAQLREAWRQLCASPTVEAALAWEGLLLRSTGSLWPEGLVVQQPLTPPVLWALQRVRYRSPSQRVWEPYEHRWPRSAQRASPASVPGGRWWGLAWDGQHRHPAWALWAATDAGRLVPLRRLWAPRVGAAHGILEYLATHATAVRVPSVEPPPPVKPARQRKLSVAEATYWAMPGRVRPVGS